MASIDLTWVIGGPQGGGVETAANIFAGACAGCGLKIFGKREYYSNIKGEHSYFGVRVSDRQIHSNVIGITMLAAFDAETVFRHAEEVSNDGAIVYESDLAAIKADEVPTLDPPFKERLEKYLVSKIQVPTGSYSKGSWYYSNSRIPVNCIRKNCLWV